MSRIVAMVDDLIAHAGRVEALTAEPEAARAAAAQMVGLDDAFGLLCRPLGVVLTPAQHAGVAACEAVSAMLGSAAGEVRTVARVMIAADLAVGEVHQRIEEQVADVAPLAIAGARGVAAVARERAGRGGGAVADVDDWLGRLSGVTVSATATATPAPGRALAQGLGEALGGAVAAGAGAVGVGVGVAAAMARSAAGREARERWDGLGEWVDLPPDPVEALRGVVEDARISEPVVR